jgi:hypothetical protein
MAHYYPDGRVDGQMSLLVKLMLVMFLPCLFGMIWLIYRYAPQLAEQYPFILTQRFKVLFVIGVPSLYLAGYIVLRNTLWG